MFSRKMLVHETESYVILKENENCAFFFFTMQQNKWYLRNFAFKMLHYSPRRLLPELAEFNRCASTVLRLHFDFSRSVRGKSGTEWRKLKKCIFIACSTLGRKLGK